MRVVTSGRSAVAVARDCGHTRGDRVRTRGHVRARREEGGQNRILVGIHNGVVRALGVVVVVGLVLVRAGRRVRVEALHRDALELRVVVSILLDVLAVPVDQTARPVDRSLAVGRQTTRPDRQLHSRRSLRVAPLVTRRVPSILAVLGASDLAVDEPGDGVGRPLDLVVVEVVVGTAGHGDVHAVGVVGDALGVEVGLRGHQVHTDELVVDFVLDVGEEDECCDHAGSAGCPEAGFDVAVPHVEGRGQHCAHRLRRHGQQCGVLVCNSLAVHHPVCLRGVSEIFVLGHDATHVLEGEGSTSAHRLRNAGVESKRGLRVATSQTVCTHTAITVLRTAWRFLWTVGAETAFLCRGSHDGQRSQNQRCLHVESFVESVSMSKWSCFRKASSW
jgi:hypothetical protein